MSNAFSDYPMMAHMAELFPLCRSITGEGTRRTLSYFEKFHPEFNRIQFPTGTKVFDWTIPKEWNIYDCYLQHIDTGQYFALFSESNLHVVGYSSPVDLILDLSELLEHIYVQDDQPDVIPYVTSYYNSKWGFCLSKNQKEMLPVGLYRAFISSVFSDGYLDITHACISGHSPSEIFFSSYVCHPSLANNELSGPVVLNALLDYIKVNHKSPRFSYRFVLLPETIGSIAYLSSHLQYMKKHTICGVNLSCVGDDRAYSYVQSPYANTLADRALSAALIGKENVHVYSFLERGSDERQYCSPGVDLPLCTFCRTKFGEYPEYHTSDDDLSLVSEQGLTGALGILVDIVDAFELCLYPSAHHLCEPQLGRRNLYADISTKSNGVPFKALNDVWAYSNGRNSIFDICILTRLPLRIVLDQLNILLSADLVFDAYGNDA